ncbi:MAG: AraC family transcriptional regulator [Duodenibacillus sp.]|nr:AraC family transcriptional regulator [Duodenibacillus sp.]
MTENALQQTLEIVLRHAGARRGVLPTDVPGLCLSVRDGSRDMAASIYSPSVCLVLQGRKVSRIGRSDFAYGAGDCLVIGVEVPARFQVFAEASDKPFACLSIRLDPGEVAELLPRMPLDEAAPAAGRGDERAVLVRAAGGGLQDAFLRLAGLLDRPREIALLAPVLRREVFCQLLLGPQGPCIRSLYAPDGQSSRIIRAIDWIRNNYTRQVTIEEMASLVHMSTSAFHRRFKAVTAVSPLQYHKQLRLHEAQRLLFAGECGVATAAYRVGYMSSSQFSRDYKALFGAAPSQDAGLQRQAA